MARHTNTTHRPFFVHHQEIFVSIVRIGLAETKGFGDGFDAIFGKKDSAEKKPAAKKPAKPKVKKKSTKKK